jgi:hypothetical protein
VLPVAVGGPCRSFHPSANRQANAAIASLLRRGSVRSVRCDMSAWSMRSSSRSRSASGVASTRANGAYCPLKERTPSERSANCESFVRGPHDDLPLLVMVFPVHEHYWSATPSCQMVCWGDGSPCPVVRVRRQASNSNSKSASSSAGGITGTAIAPVRTGDRGRLGCLGLRSAVRVR